MTGDADLWKKIVKFVPGSSGRAPVSEIPRMNAATVNVNEWIQDVDELFSTGKKKLHGFLHLVLFIPEVQMRPYYIVMSTSGQRQQGDICLSHVCYLFFPWSSWWTLADVSLSWSPSWCHSCLHAETWVRAQMGPPRLSPPPVNDITVGSFSWDFAVSFKWSEGGWWGLSAWGMVTITLTCMYLICSVGKAKQHR